MDLGDPFAICLERKFMFEIGKTNLPSTKSRLARLESLLKAVRCLHFGRAVYFVGVRLVTTNSLIDFFVL